MYPHWFAVQVSYADLASPRHATGAGYVLFTQAAQGAAWKNLLEPYLLTGSGPALLVQTDAEGYAIEASLNGNDLNLSVTPGQIQEATAASLEGAADTMKNPGNLADLQDQASFRPRLPEGSADTDRHYASGPVFGLKTADGGALTFYGLMARLSLTPPPSAMFELDIPGYYSPSQTLTSATVMYVDQFAACIPRGLARRRARRPPVGTAPRISRRRSARSRLQPCRGTGRKRNHQSGCPPRPAVAGAVLLMPAGRPATADSGSAAI